MGIWTTPLRKRDRRLHRLGERIWRRYWRAVEDLDRDAMRVIGERIAHVARAFPRVLEFHDLMIEQALLPFFLGQDGTFLWRIRWRTNEHLVGFEKLAVGIALFNIGELDQAELFARIRGEGELLECVTRLRAGQALPGDAHWMLRYLRRPTR